MDRKIFLELRSKAALQPSPKQRVESNRKNRKNKELKMAPHSLSDVTQVSRSPEVQNWFGKMLF